MSSHDRPILFSGEMVRAILEGKKTQTRRVIKRTGVDEEMDGMLWRPDQYGDWHPIMDYCRYHNHMHLWVRETWAIATESWTDYGWEGDGIVDVGIPKEKPQNSMHQRYWVLYKADGYYDAEDGEAWRPSIHMPRWASRITLEVTSVRVERVQDISEADARAEGVSTNTPELDPFAAYPAHMRPVSAFRLLWDSINAKRGYGWDVNPWVWVVAFKVVQP